MSILQKIQEILDSQLSDEVKLETIRFYVQQSEKPKPFIPERPLPELQTWDDTGWWKQQQENAKADADSILHPTITWENTHNNDTPMQDLIRLTSEGLNGSTEE